MFRPQNVINDDDTGDNMTAAADGTWYIDDGRSSISPWVSWTAQCAHSDAVINN